MADDDDPGGHSHLVEFPEALEAFFTRVGELKLVLGGAAGPGVDRLEAVIQSALAARDRGDVPAAMLGIVSAMELLAELADRTPGVDGAQLRGMAAAFRQAIQTAHRSGRQMAAFHERHDVLLTPALGTLPPKLGWLDMMMSDLDEYWRRVFGFSPFTVWFNLTGQPAMMLPLGRSADGLPVAVQVVGRFGDESAIFRLAAQLERARPWIARKPPLAT